MNVDFWKEEYFFAPSFEEMYNFVEEHPSRSWLFYSQFEADYGDDLFYQMCCYGDLTCEQYAQCESNLARVFEELAKKDQIVAYVEARNILSSRKAKKLTGLVRLQLNQLKSFCNHRQKITTPDEVEKLLLCMTRGVGTVCVLAVNWRILLLMQDLHGCIVFDENSDKNGIEQLIKTFEKNTFVISPIKQ